MNSIVNDNLPKYSRYQLLNMMKKKDNLFLNEEEEKLYEQIISGVIFKQKHYDLISKKLNIPAHELFQRENETKFDKIFYRTSKEVSKQELQPIIKIFRLFSEQSKIRGNI